MSNKIANKITTKHIYNKLSEVLDPELNVDIVSMGLIYDVSVSPFATPSGTKDKFHILMTLTTPGCPLIGTIEQNIREKIAELDESIDKARDIHVELTFDPPWIPDMMTEEARAELGF